MSEKHKKEIILLLTSLIILITVTLMFGGLFSQCGLGPEKRTIVEIEQPPEPKIPDPIIKEPEEKFCDGLPVSTIRDKECPDDGIGKIVEVCRPDGKWWEASRDCRQACEQDVITWENFVKDVIIDNCSECHGAYREFEAVKNLALTGIGGAGGISKLIYYMTLPETDDRSMPKDLPNLDLDTSNKIKEWVDGGAVKESSCEETAQVIDLFYIDKAINDFGNKLLLEEDRFNYRFFTFAHKFNQGLPLDQSYKALNRALNAISFDNDIQLCQPIDEKGVVCGVDIRSLQLDADDFRVIGYGDEFKFISNSTLGKVNQDLFGTDQVFFHYDVLIDAIFDNANIYNFLMGFDDRDQFFSVFGINFDQDLIDNNYKLVGTNQSEISGAAGGNATRLISIHEGDINGFDTQVHISFDNPEDEDPAADLFQNPFLANSDRIFKFVASEAIGGLPNGLHSYILANNEGVLQDFAPTNIVNCNVDGCRESQIDVPIDCMLCHQSGYIPKLDVIGDHIRNSRQFDFEDVKLAKQLYLDQNRNAATFNNHNDRYLKALNKLGIQAGERNHLVQDYVILSKPKNLKQIAAFLFVSEDYLKSCINSSGELAELIGGLLTGASLTRDSLINALPVLLEQCEINIDPIIPVSGG